MKSEEFQHAGELRRCHVTGRWNLVPGRARRQRGKLESLLRRRTRQLFPLSWRGDCPFCPGWFEKTEASTHSYGGQFSLGRAPNEPAATHDAGIFSDSGQCGDWEKEWDVFAIKNKQPLLPLAPSDHQAVRSGEVLSEKIAGIGFSEVIVETSGKDQVPNDLKNQRATLKNNIIKEIRNQPSPWDAHPPLGVLKETTCRHLLQLFLRRFNAMKEDRRIRYISVFRNHGPESGATLEHPHSQIIASPIIPAQVANELTHAREHYESIGGRCVVCELLEGELARHSRRKDARNTSRVVYSPEGAHFVVIHPYASTAPFETWIIPKDHQKSFGDIDHEPLDNLAGVLTWTLGRLYVCLDNPAYNMVFKSAPFPAKGDAENKFDFYHWYIVIQPQRLLVPGGYEMSTGISVNPTPPESEENHDRSDKYGGMGSVEFIKSGGFLFDEDKAKPGTLLWHQEKPTDDEKERLHITWESKQKTLRNIVKVLNRERDELSANEKTALKRAEQAASNHFEYTEHEAKRQEDG